VAKVSVAIYGTTIHTILG